MERMTKEEMIAVLSASLRGEPIQWQPVNTIHPDVWRPMLPSGTWDFGCYHFRVRPREPRSIWVPELIETQTLAGERAYSTAADAMTWAGGCRDRYRAVEFREVLP